MNQYIVQRVLGAKNEWHASAGAILAGALKLLPLFVMVLPGTMALAFPELSHLQKGDLVYPTLVQTFLPAGIKGLVLAGLTAALMSSIASTLNSSATLLIQDFVVPRRPDLTPQALLRWGRLATAGFMILAALWAPLIQFFPGIFPYIQQVFAFLAPPLVAIFFAGFFLRQVSAKAAWITLLAGHLVAFSIMVLQFMGMVSLHYTIVAGFLTLIAMVCCVLLSLVWPNIEDKSTFMFQPSNLRKHITHWIYDLRIYASIVLVLMLALLVAFW